MSKFTKDQKSILALYTKLAERTGRHPTMPDMLFAGVTRNKIRHHFGSITALGKAAKEESPASFKNIVDGDLFSNEKLSFLKGEIPKYKRFVITSFVTGCDAHEGFLKSIKSYCDKNDAKLLLLPSSDPAAIVEHKQYIDPLLASEAIVFTDLALNDNFWISSIKLSAKHIDPLTGLGRIGQRDGSLVFASPKQRLKMVPTSSKKLPHAIMTSGAITLPNYSTKRYMSERTATIAHHDHIIGAIVVEIANSKLFHYRQIQSDTKGSFADIGVLYNPDGTTEEYRPLAHIKGDLHSGQSDPVCMARTVFDADSIRAVTKPRKVYIHDGFNGLSINPHEVKHLISLARRALDNLLDLDTEVHGYAYDLNEISKHYDIVKIVKSNHDIFLERYLQEALYTKHPRNHLLGLELAAAMIRGEDPLKYAVERTGLIENPKKFHWLQIDEDSKEAEQECGSHGHIGANGTRGSLRAMENAFGASNSGHAHTPEILRQCYQAGTNSLLDLDYNKGPSSWMHADILVYPNGQRQIINVINGEWRLVS